MQINKSQLQNKHKLLLIITFLLYFITEMGRGSPRFRSDSPRHQRFETPRGNTSLWSETSRTSAFGSSSGSSRPQQPAQSSRRPTFNSSYFCTPRGGVSKVFCICIMPTWQVIQLKIKIKPQTMHWHCVVY